jgi:hypothetical protein
MGASVGSEPQLDDWLADPVIRTRHRREAPVAPAVLWRAAQDLRLDETRTLGKLIAWRIPGTPARQTFRELFARDPFVVLDEGPTHSVSGLCGRIWTLRRDYPHLDGPRDFDTWDEPGTARVVFAHWVQETDTGSALLSEARVEALDARARFALSILWPTVRGFERRIGGEALALAADRASR